MAKSVSVRALCASFLWLCAGPGLVTWDGREVPPTYLPGTGPDQPPLSLSAHSPQAHVNPQEKRLLAGK